VEVILPGKVISLSCSWKVSGVILGSGEVFVWGGGENGVLGLGNLKGVEKPTNLGLKNVVSLRLGSLHAAAITKNGELYTWGRNSWGNLGHGDQKDRLVPTLVKEIPPVSQVSVVRGLIGATVGPGKCGPHTIATTREGSAYFFGAGHKGKGGNLVNKWGFHLRGVEDEVSPYLIGGEGRDEKSSTDYLKGETIVQAVAAGLHSALLTQKGLVYTFGCGSDGRMGLDGYLKGCGAGRQQMKYYVSPPTPVEEFVRQKAQVLMCDSSRRHMIALTKKRSV